VTEARETLAGDRIVVTIPSDDGFEAVAQLVLSGVAARLDLTYEGLDDLGTAFQTLLERREDGTDLTVELEIGDDVMTASIGPLDEGVVGELEGPQQGVSLRRVLETVVDSFGVDRRDSGQWVELQKRIVRTGEA
jgi:hypothetical protein